MPSFFFHLFYFHQDSSRVCPSSPAAQHYGRDAFIVKNNAAMFQNFMFYFRLAQCFASTPSLLLRRISSTATLFEGKILHVFLFQSFICIR